MVSMVSRNIVNFPFKYHTEQIEDLIHLKKGKACGPDNIMPEHVIYDGDFLNLWLKVFN